VPAELDAEFPPPAWTVPTEFEVVFPPDPPTEMGADASAWVAGAEALADGLAEVCPTCTVPIEFVAVFPGSAKAVRVAPSAAAHSTTATSMSLLNIVVSFST
jgi:hypothetical protein